MDSGSPVSLTYDAWNRLVKVEDDNAATIGEYEYDALMRRVEEDGKKLFQSANWQVVEERNATGDTTGQYTWSPVYVDAMVARDRDTNPGSSSLEERLYVQQDANFNVTSVSDDQGDIVERYVYDPYGERTVLDETWEEVPGNASAYDFQHGHQGGTHDDYTGIMHFRNRDYSPTLMRWMQQDPLGYVDGMNGYQAYLENPVVRLDPSGLQSAFPNPQKPWEVAHYLFRKLQDLQRRKDYDWNTNGGKEGPDGAWLWEQYQAVEAALNLARKVRNLSNWFECGGRYGPNDELQASQDMEAILQYAATFGVELSPSVKEGLAHEQKEALVEAIINALAVGTAKGGGTVARANTAKTQTALPNAYWQNRTMPKYVTPGVRVLTDMKPSSAGGVYRRTAYYDNFGRLIGQTHDTTHGYGPNSQNPHPNPHHHRWDPVTGQQLRGPDGSVVFPGPFAP